tara:strand:+ start:788 stop:1237 length:450 start_codon:yes stop_codon:yes gene_type:complete
MEWEEIPSFPQLILPDAPVMPGATLEVPRASIPSYEPLVVPPNTLRPPPGIEGINTKDEAPEKETKNPSTKPYVPPEAQIIEVPFTEIEVPMPTTTIMTTAATTAFISVAATLLGQSLFKYLVMLFKPIFKQAWSKLTKKKTVESPETS